MDLKTQKFELEYAGRTLSLETSRLAEQANAAVLGTYGNSTVLATVVMGKKDKESGWFPLSVEYEERFYAVGKILGSRFVRREGKSSEEAVLSGRVIDRTIRPLFNQRMRRDVQVVVTILSYDEDDDLDFLALTSASTALAISDVPWDGPVAGVKIVQNKKGEILINPKNSELVDVNYQLFASGPVDRINMIEAEGIEASEAEALKGFELAQAEINKLVAFQNSIVAKIGKKKQVVQLAELDEALKAKVSAFVAGKLEPAIYAPTKMEYEVGLVKIFVDLVVILYIR
jgi:polyribonucleotide nucleotidyltransferase